MSTTPTLDSLQASMQARTDEVLRMCADIQANLEAQHAMLYRLRGIVESRDVRAVAHRAERAGNSHAVRVPAA